MLIVIDIGCSFIKMYRMNEDGVEAHLTHPMRKETVIEDTKACYFEILQDITDYDFIVISTSDSVAWEDSNGHVEWLSHEFPPHWEDGLPPYSQSGHPRYDKLRGAANQMLWLQREIGLDNINRILPLSAMCAAFNFPDWKMWDYTHASNSGFFDFRTGTWAKEMTPFLEAGVIHEEILSPKHRIPYTKVDFNAYLGGHDSTFASAVDTPYSVKPYLSCGTWVTISVPTMIRSDTNIGNEHHDRYVYAPNGATLKQRCFYAGDYTPDETVRIVLDFLINHYEGIHDIPKINVFGSWAHELREQLEPTRFDFRWFPRHEEFGCCYLPLKVQAYLKSSV